MRRSKLSLDAKDFATFAAWSDRDNLLSTWTRRSISEIVHYISLLPRRSTWIGPKNDDCRCTIIALHFSGCGYHHSSARTFFSMFVSKSIVPATQYIVVSSAYRYVSADFNEFGRSSIKSENKSKNRPLRDSMSYTVYIEVTSVDSDELSSICEVVFYPQPNISSDFQVI